MAKRTKPASQKQKPKPWNSSDEDRLIDNIRNYPTRKQAFQQTSLELQRTPLACAAHWYTATSRNTKHVCLLTISGNRLLVNRTQGKGVSSPLPLYKKVLFLLGLNY